MTPRDEETVAKLKATIDSFKASLPDGLRLDIGTACFLTALMHPHEPLTSARLGTFAAAMVTEEECHGVISDRIGTALLASGVPGDAIHTLAAKAMAAKITADIEAAKLGRKEF
jgi:hypothetical protein